MTRPMPLDTSMIAPAEATATPASMAKAVAARRSCGFSRTISTRRAAMSFRTKPTGERML